MHRFRRRARIFAAVPRGAVYRAGMEQVTIDRLGHQGDGLVSGAQERFVPFTLPGEVVTLDADGALASLHTPSPERVEPVCAHFGTCGGCAVQHASDRFVAAWKVNIVRRALAARGIEMQAGGIATSPPGTRRRAVFGGRRSRKGGVTIGFHARATNTLIDITECPVTDPRILAARPALEALTGLGASRTAAIRLSVTLSAAGLDVAVDEASPLDRKLEPKLAAIASEHGLARLSWNGEIVVTPSQPVQRMGRAQVVPPPGAFLQATPHGQAALTATVRQAVGRANRVVDLFAGCGTFTLPLSESAEVHAVENDAPMLEALQTAWRRVGGLSRVTVEARDLFRRPLLPLELKGFEAAVIDPPRAGAAAQVAQLASSDVPVIAFVSCNPVTFARDAQVLVEAGFQMGPVRVVDQFRWSPHVELATTFTR